MRFPFIVFDLDGTLIDGYAAIADALAHAMRRLGYPELALPEVRTLVGHGLERLLEKAVGADRAAEGVRHFRERYPEVAVEKTELMPDVPQVLAELARRGHPMAVASNKPARFSRLILEAKGVAGYFRTIAGPDETTPPKPDPAMLRGMMREAAASPADTVVVGDMEIDAEMARASGCRVVLVPGGSRTEEELARIEADGRLRSLAELPRWLEAWPYNAAHRESIAPSSHGVSRVVVAEQVAAAGLDLLRQAGHQVQELTGATREQLLAELATADALLVRSATTVDKELLAAAPRLSVIGRAGVGVDNVDVPAATARGVLVINAPTANVVSAVEHTFALLFALLRRIPDAAVSMKQGKWEKSRFVGSELAGKTLGIIGLGQVGSRVAARARAFEARLLGHDPYLPAEKAREMGVPLVALPELLKGSDIVTLHATATEKGKVLLGREEFARMRRGAILLNVARGSLVDPRALHDALASGHLAGAALDVFDPEPPAADDPLRRLPNVVSTPHLGASTVEAQERVSLQTVQAVLEALRGDSYVPAVNLPFRGPADPTGAAAWMRLAERTGQFLAALGAEPLSGLSVETWGLPEDLLRPVAVAAVKGALEEHSPETVNFVNALHFARERGLSVVETRHEDTGNYARSIRVTLALPGGRNSAEATLFAGRDPRVVEVDGLPLEFRPEGTIVFLRNRDVPGVVGSVGTILGEAGVNIANFSLARGEGARAAAIIAVDSPPPSTVLDRLRKAPAVEEVRVVTW